jgi:hypothetical protein
MRRTFIAQYNATASVSLTFRFAFKQHLNPARQHGNLKLLSRDDVG